MDQNKKNLLVDANEARFFKIITTGSNDLIEATRMLKEYNPTITMTRKRPREEQADDVVALEQELRHQ